jgi:4-amino-4-deoxy-L-arabinose transferase-like glycosyltransferase
LFWDNLVVRFSYYANSSDAVRDLGHPNWPGKYLAELPVYLLPWTPLLVAAIFRLWRDARLRSAVAGPIRFAMCACVPALIILSFASTSRGVYAAPLVPGIALLVAVVLTAPDADPQMAFRSSLKWTTFLLIAVDGGLLVTAAAITWLRGPGELVGLCVSLAGLVWLVIGAGVMRKPESVDGSVIRLAGAHVVALIAISLALYPLFNRSQDLARMASFVDEASGERPLVLWLPDETTLAMSDLYLRKPTCAAWQSGQLSNCLERYPRAAVLALGDCPEAECGSVLDFIRRQDLMQRRSFGFHDAALSAAGVVFVDGIVRAGGRAYLVGLHQP